jgi:hypothetical protein
MSFNIQEEKVSFIASRASRDTYKTTDKLERRTRKIFQTFARTLHGRGGLSQRLKDREMETLIHVVRSEIVNPLLTSSTSIAVSQSRFDHWHKDAVEILKTRCPIHWDDGSRLTVGMAQKIVNLHSKDIWALDLVPERYSRFFHPIIDNVTLNLLQEKVRWTKLNSYDAYMRLQSKFRQMARRQDTYPLALECWWWNRK